MTGFGRSQGEIDGAGWTWELRAVNGKGLDTRIRLPQGYEFLEPECRQTIARNVCRGNLQAGLTLRQTEQRAVAVVNREALDNVTRKIDEIEASRKTSPSSAAQILSLRGVLDVTEPQLDDEQRAVIGDALINGLGEALEALNGQRRLEGDALRSILLAQLDRISQLTRAAEADPSRTTEAIVSRLNEQVQRVCAGNNSVDPDRLYQEVAILATKADIREELDRLVAHVEAAGKLLKEGSPVGRKLEFLAQEFNRESNTLCSKSNAVSLTEIGLELKVVIDQFREQILNVE